MVGAVTELTLRQNVVKIRIDRTPSQAIHEIRDTIRQQALVVVFVASQDRLRTPAGKRPEPDANTLAQMKSRTIRIELPDDG